MRIDSKLNLVIEVETSQGSVFIHSTPIGREVFEKYFLIIGKAFAQIISEGLSFISGPRLAALMLKKIAMENGVWDTVDGVNNGLMAEIRRLTNVAIAGLTGWSLVPLSNAIGSGLLDEDDVAEVEGLIAFFICTSAMSRKTEVAAVLAKMIVWGAQTTSLSCTEFAASLPISTQEEPSPTVTTSSVPH